MPRPSANRGRYAPALTLDVVATGSAAILTDHVQAERGRIADRLVPVGGEATALVRAIRERAAAGVRLARQLAGEIDVTGGRAAAVVGARRALEDFYLLDVEHVAHGGTQVADAVEEDRVLRVEAAHEDRVAALGVAVLTQLER